MNDASTAKSKKTVGRPKSSAKRKSILKSASELFLQFGYDRTSMDNVAKASDVSKQTVYSHFKTKDQLYNAVIEMKCDQYRIEEATNQEQAKPLRHILQDIALNFIELLNDEQVIAMYSVVIGESKHNPHVAQLFYDAGHKHSIDLVKDLLMQHPQSNLPAESAFELSVDFYNLLKGDFHMLSLLGLPYDASPAAQEQLARKTVTKMEALIALAKQK